jgi:hypothetical protein
MHKSDKFRFVGQNADPVNLSAGISGIALNPSAVVSGQYQSIDRRSIRHAGILSPAAMALIRAAVSPRISEVLCNSRKQCATQLFLQGCGTCPPSFKSSIKGI